jgi:uncharacterized phage protein (TIGR01671 family)
MSREIKFRVWDPHKKIYLDLAIAWSPDMNANYGIDGCENHYPTYDGYVIEQFTGLKDSQGKDIYEGDIVKWSHGPGVSDVGVVEYRTRDEFSSHPMAAFYGLSVSRFAGLCQFQSDDSYEVVGNIHETPELLKK